MVRHSGGSNGGGRGGGTAAPDRLVGSTGGHQFVRPPGPLQESLAPLWPLQLWQFGAATGSPPGRFALGRFAPLDISIPGRFATSLDMLPPDHKEQLK